MCKKTILMSPADSKLLNYFKKNFDVIESDVCNFAVSYERRHADMQVLKIKDKIFLNSQCTEVCKALKKRGIEPIICNEIVGEYPKNVALNAALVGDKLLCKESALHHAVKEYCLTHDIKIINVNQGYAKCSTLILNDNNIITDDESIFRISLINNINVLKIEKGDIYLNDNTVGFIGGSSTVINNTVYFFGDINTHRNADSIRRFIEQNGLDIKSVMQGKLQDIGSIVMIQD